MRKMFSAAERSSPNFHIISTRCVQWFARTLMLMLMSLSWWSQKVHKDLILEKMSRNNETWNINDTLYCLGVGLWFGETNGLEPGRRQVPHQVDGPWSSTRKCKFLRTGDVEICFSNVKNVYMLECLNFCYTL